MTTTTAAPVIAKAPLAIKPYTLAHNLPEIDYSEEGTFRILQQEFSLFSETDKERYCDTLNRQWWSQIWQNLRNRWEPTLGPTLRKSIAVTSQSGEELQSLYANTWHDLARSQGLRIDWPGYSVEQITSGEYKERKIDKKKGEYVTDSKGQIVWVTKKLTRAMAANIADQLVTSDITVYHDRYETRYDDNTGKYSALEGNPPYPPEKPTEEQKQLAAAFVSQLEDRIRAANGAYAVISANPLELLYSSEYANFTSCHGWTSLRKSQQHSSGNWAYIAGNNTLIVTLVRPGMLCAINGDGSTLAAGNDDKKAPTLDASKIGKSDACPMPKLGLIPKKHFRQFVFVPENHRNEVAWFGRAYPAPLPEVSHSEIRRLVASVLTGESPDKVTWKHEANFPRSIAIAPDFVSGYAYGDPVSSVMVLGKKAETFNPKSGLEYHEVLKLCHSRSGNYKAVKIGSAICPCCNTTRTDSAFNSLLCPQCQQLLIRDDWTGKVYKLSVEAWQTRQWIQCRSTKQYIHPDHLGNYRQCHYSGHWERMDHMNLVHFQSGRDPVWMTPYSCQVLGVKLCNTCGTFYHPNLATGHIGYCKTCQTAGKPRKA